MRIAINAVPLRPGGGLTVLLGLMRGLKGLETPVSISVVCRHGATRDQVLQSGDADEVKQLSLTGGEATALLWQHTRLGKWARLQEASALLSFNHHALNVACPQVVYHINLRRFVNRNDVNGPVDWLKEKLRDIAAGWAIQHAQANVFESDYLRQQALKVFPSPRADHTVSYIGLPDGLIDRAAESADLFEQRPDLLAITSPFPHKDNPTLVRTLADLVRRDPRIDWRLRVAGGGPEQWSPEQQLAQQLGVAERIEWLGFCDQARLDGLLRNSLCLIAPSRLESFAMVAVESMARRCPAIVADTAAMPESVGSAGLLATPGDPISFADAVQRLHNDPNLRSSLIESGLERIASLRWSQCGKDFGSIFQRLAA